MSIISLCLAFLAVSVTTYLLFKVMSLTSASLLFKREDALLFQSKLKGSFGLIAITSNIFGTLTSLATVYIFFIGTSKLFGIFILAAPASVAISFFVTNYFTRRVLANRPDFADLLEKADTTTAVVARLMWDATDAGRRTSWIVKWLSITNIVSVLWLEFSVFGDLAAIALGRYAGSLWSASVVVFLSTFVIFLIIIRYGLRGFVFADILHSPFVIAGTVSVLAGLLMTVFSEPSTSSLDLFLPMIPMSQVGLFVAHVFALNCFFVLLTEGHWFRLWLFREREITGQAMGTICTAAIWSILALAGCLSILLTQQSGIDGILPILNALDDINPALTFLFWFGASAALFSATDAQIYGLILVWNYKPNSGGMSATINRPTAPIRISLSASLLFGAGFAVTRYWNIPFEKLVFTLFPVCLNSLPAFIAVAMNRRIVPWWTASSVVLYASCVLVGFFRPNEELIWTLAAALVPIVLSLVMMMASNSQSPLGQEKIT